MNNKPTAEELKANIESITNELENTPPSAEEPDDVETPEPSKADVTPDDEEEADTSEPSRATDEPDYKKKFTESSREALILHSKNKKINDAIERAQEMAEPTDEELAAEYGDLSEMSELEKRLARENLANKRKFNLLDEVTKESKNIEEWNEKVDAFIDSPQTLVDIPDLEGKQDEFKAFAGKATRRGVDFETLVAAFLHEADKARIKHKGKMLESGNAGADKAEKPKKLTMEEGRKLRSQNYNLWKQYLSQGKIEMNV